MVFTERARQPIHDDIFTLLIRHVVSSDRESTARQPATTVCRNNNVKWTGEGDSLPVSVQLTLVRLTYCTVHVVFTERARQPIHDDVFTLLIRHVVSSDRESTARQPATTVCRNTNVKWTGEGDSLPVSVQLTLVRLTYCTVPVVFTERARQPIQGEFSRHLEVTHQITQRCDDHVAEVDTAIDAVDAIMPQSNR